jgi:hypothetical protein
MGGFFFWTILNALQWTVVAMTKMAEHPSKDCLENLKRKMSPVYNALVSATPEKPLWENADALVLLQVQTQALNAIH